MGCCRSFSSFFPSFQNSTIPLSRLFFFLSLKDEGRSSSETLLKRSAPQAYGLSRVVGSPKRIQVFRTSASLVAALALFMASPMVKPFSLNKSLIISLFIRACLSGSVNPDDVQTATAPPPWAFRSASARLSAYRTPGKIHSNRSCSQTKGNWRPLVRLSASSGQQISPPESPPTHDPYNSPAGALVDPSQEFCPWPGHHR